jgi:hypothetical protein
MTPDEKKVTKILLNFSQLAGQMLESSQSDVVKINDQSTLLIDPKWMKTTGEWIGKNCKYLSHLVSAIANANNPPNTPNTAKE